MSDILADLILSLAPEDGSAIGNAAMMARMRARVPNMTDDDYLAARDIFVGAGLLVRGRGRGGSIFLIPNPDKDDDLEDEVGGFDLLPTEESPVPQRRVITSRTTPRKADGPVQVLSYRHGETRVNNPEVGMDHAGLDPDSEKTVRAYHPRLDAVLNFNSARAGIERLIDEALASSDTERMRDALQELKRLQAPYI
ncbi:MULTISPECIES: hypothetical protein [unclassified Paracoccus (in: a-proteobacteria)]|uniref:hypothetical protein n=1 Tax=unclassified Paracoccus (in: a-proteobacteria) TaxID=2688777 RepID=UPI00190D2DE6|nr:MULTISPECIES: hypothetical protein [unclassified Paracoccus (in: a-proteobacteria)]QQO45795.1 hypothetical protein JGR78_05630 [Paracoccus sp. MC1862]